jgi:hypothetical protein
VQKIRENHAEAEKTDGPRFYTDIVVPVNMTRESYVENRWQICLDLFCALHAWEIKTESVKSKE